MLLSSVTKLVRGVIGGAPYGEAALVEVTAGIGCAGCGVMVVALAGGEILGDITDLTVVTSVTATTTVRSPGVGGAGVTAVTTAGAMHWSGAGNDGETDVTGIAVVGGASVTSFVADITGVTGGAASVTRFLA